MIKYAHISPKYASTSYHCSGVAARPESNCASTSIPKELLEELITFPCTLVRSQGASETATILHVLLKLLIASQSRLSISSTSSSITYSCRVIHTNEIVNLDLSEATS